MPHIVNTAAVLMMLGLAPSLAFAETGRYTMTPTENGFLRLDTQTGAVSNCSRADGQWTCLSVADDRMALEQEIARLAQENAELRAKLGESGSSADSGATDGKRRLELPDEKEVEKVMSFVERMIQRFKDLMESMDDRDKSGTPL